VSPRGQTLSVLFLAAIAALLAVSGQSLWIDEANSAVKAVAPDWSSFAGMMRSERGSDLQMPLYMAGLWAWEKLVGPSEWGLRALNIPMFLIACGTVLAIWRVPRGPRVLWILLAATSAMVWAYLDEARPYMMQFLAATLMAVPMANAGSRKERVPKEDLAVFAAGTVLLCGSSLVGILFAAFLVPGFAALCLRGEKPVDFLRRRDVAFVSAAALLLLAGFGVYYAWTLSVGARASGVGRTGPGSLAFCAYEMAGLAGSGPGRGALRENPGPALRSHIWCLIGHAAVVALYGAWGFAEWRRQGGRVPHGVLLVGVLVLLGGTATILAGLLGDFRVLGRHLLPCLPFLLMALAIFGTALWQRPGPAGRTVVLALLAASLMSAAMIRFSPAHAKDDYRAAAHDVLSQRQAAWWAADDAAARFYGLAPRTAGSTPPGEQAVWSANSRDLTYLTALPSPGLVVLSKPDIYDTDGILRAWLKENNYTIVRLHAAFTIWAPSADPVPRP
jgi:hypothetical protein